MWNAPTPTSNADGNPVVNGTATRGLLNPDHCTLCLIDHQAPTALAVQSIDRQTLINNVAGLAQAGKPFNLPTVIASIAADDQNGPSFSQILDVFPDADVINRQNINCWEEPRFVAALEAARRRKLVMAALWTEVCPVMPVLSAIADGYDVDVVTDASGGTSVHPARLRAGRPRARRGAGGRPCAPAPRQRACRAGRGVRRGAGRAT